jgi:hypothetical protein
MMIIIIGTAVETSNLTYIVTHLKIIINSVIIINTYPINIYVILKQDVAYKKQQVLWKGDAFG